MIQSIPSAAGSAPGGAVGGGSNLTTVGAVPYVVSAGLLGQAPTNFSWDNTNTRLQLLSGVATAQLTLVNSLATAFIPQLSLLAPNMTAGQTNYFAIGKAESTKNSASFNYTWQSNGSNSNRFGFYHYGTAELFSIFGNGDVTVGGTTDGNYRFDVQASGSTGTMRVFDQGGAGSSLFVLQAGASQSGNLLSVRNNAGTELAYFNSGGALTTPFIVAGPSQLANAVVDINYTNANVFGMGGPLALRWSSGSTGTSGFDSGLKRAGAGYIAVTDGSTGLGKIVVSQATPSASTDAGTAGAIWADATYVYVQTGASTVKRIALTTF